MAIMKALAPMEEIIPHLYSLVDEAPIALDPEMRKEAEKSVGYRDAVKAIKALA